MFRTMSMCSRHSLSKDKIGTDKMSKRVFGDQSCTKSVFHWSTLQFCKQGLTWRFAHHNKYHGLKRQFQTVLLALTECQGEQRDRHPGR
jgi:hypothetical protein